MEAKNILIIGGTGSLGTKLVTKFIKHNKIMNISRDEEKQWKLYNSVSSYVHNLQQVIGDIFNYDELRGKIYKFNPHIIIFTAALKHIDICEKQIYMCVRINYEAISKMINDIEINTSNYSNLESFIFVSTDKACMPITVYGQSKAITEKLIQTTKIANIKFTVVRYGNVLNSSGSILPLLHNIGKDVSKQHFMLTDKNMTRFIITLDDSVNLIEYAITYAESNEIIVPYLKSCKISDLCNIFSKIYNKPVIIGQLRCIEKYHEDLISQYESNFTYKINDNYIHISSKKQDISMNELPFSSNNSIITMEELEAYLKTKKYI